MYYCCKVEGKLITFISKIMFNFLFYLSITQNIKQKYFYVIDVGVIFLCLYNCKGQPHNHLQNKNIDEPNGGFV